MQHQHLLFLLSAVANIQVGSDVASGHGTVTSDVSNGGLGFGLPQGRGGQGSSTSRRFTSTTRDCNELTLLMILSDTCHCSFTLGVPELISIMASLYAHMGAAGIKNKSV